MLTTPEQLAAANKANVEAMLTLANTSRGPVVDQDASLMTVSRNSPWRKLARDCLNALRKSVSY